MPESGEDLARHNDGRALGHGVGADVTGEPMPHDQPGPDEENGSRRTALPSEAEKSPLSRKPFYTRPLAMAVLAVLLLGGAVAGVRFHPGTYHSNQSEGIGAGDAGAHR
jgi:hypothetical protein